jgi:fumarylacetoacetase
MINETHDINLKSWIESANAPDTDFPIQNLPFCRFELLHTDYHAPPQIGVVIGDYVLSLIALNMDEKFLESIGESRSIVYGDAWLLDSEKTSKLRSHLVNVLKDDCSEEIRETLRQHLHSISDCMFYSLFNIRNYTDFYCSIFHATNVGAMFRPDNPLLPNYKYVPIGYHGRASSIIVYGSYVKEFERISDYLWYQTNTAKADIKRPKGQNRADADAPPVFIPAKNLDYEMEVGFIVGKGNNLGEPIPIENAEEHIVGLCLVNDWSARDIQAWEYQPLGPFLAKNFATTISPFVVTMEALAPFRVPAFEREEGDPQPLDYLNGEQNQKFGGFDIKLEVYIQTEKMREENVAPFMLSRSNMKDLYWTIGQMLTHHASNGCNLQTGDLMATGTVSGREKHERGCLLELTWRGKEPIELPNGETRRFLEDYDEIIMKGYCEREGFRRIGFGECRGMILPAD